MDNNQTLPSKKNKALILIITASLLVIFIIAITLLMAKNTGSQAPIQSANNNSSQDAAVNGDIANPPLSAKAIAKEQAIKEQQLAAQANQSETVATIAVGEPAPGSNPSAQDEHRTSELINISVGNGAFTPLSFTVAAGTKIDLALRSIDNQAHTLTFNDPTLDRNNITVEAGQTRNSTLKTPPTPGTYSFSCTIPGHADKGEIGKMIVQ